MGWLSDMFGSGSSEPDYWDKKFRERMAKEQKERDEIFDMSKNVDQINERLQKNNIAYRRSLLKERKDQVREEHRKEDKATDDLKVVINTAKLQCDLCTNPVGKLKVNYNTPTIQGKRTATVKEKDQTSLIFKGNCKQSPNSSSPCASVMQLGQWKDIGNIKFQEEYVLLQKSTIKCNYGNTDIIITDCAQRNEPANIGAIGAPVPTIKPFDFDIKLELDTTKDTIVPFGLLDFENKAENEFFRFKYTLEKSDIDEFYFDIITENGDYLYTHNCLKPAIVDNEYKEPLFKTKKTSQIPMNSALIPEGSPDFEQKDYTAMGTYIISWDGFDKDGIYDSTRFNNKDLKAKVTAIKNGRRKSIFVDFSTKYSQVEWTDVKIDKNTNRIDVTLRVNLTDGGAEGLSCSTANASDIYRMPARTICDWDKIPQDAIKHNHKHPPIKTRTKNFTDLCNLALQGIDTYWSRTLGKTGNIGTLINSEVWEILVHSEQNKNGMEAPKIIYFTNSENKTSNRSHNFEGFRELYYKAGYTYYSDWEASAKNTIIYNSKGWYFTKESDVIDKFLETSAHEIGHQLLFEYGGRDNSYTHKKTSHWSWIMQDPIPGSTYPITGEIDLMKYVDENILPTDYYSRVVIAPEDLLGLIWLTKIKVL